jgi:hypothetical protein
MLASAAHKLAKKANSAPLEQAGDVVHVLKLAQGVHGWERQEASSSPITGLSSLQINLQVNS